MHTMILGDVGKDRDKRAVNFNAGVDDNLHVRREDAERERKKKDEKRPKHPCQPAIHTLGNGLIDSQASNLGAHGARPNTMSVEGEKRRERKSGGNGGSVTFPSFTCSIVCILFPGRDGVAWRPPRKKRRSRKGSSK
jgi:hypothetical protein